MPSLLEAQAVSGPKRPAPSARRRWPARLATATAAAAAAAAAAASLCLGGALAQGVTPPSPSPSLSARPAAPPPNALVAAATNLGLVRCLPALERMSSLVTQGTRGNDVLIDWDRKRGNASPVFSMIGMEFTNAGAAASITVIPEADNGCSVMAERISVAPFTCRSVAERELAGYQTTRLLPSFNVYVDPRDRNSSVSLIDSPPGCLIIRRFVEFNWKNPVAAAPAAAPAAGR